MLPAVALALMASCSDLSNLQDSVLSNLGDGSTLTYDSLKVMHKRISDAVDETDGCADEKELLIETLFGLEEMANRIKLTKSKGSN